MKIANQKALESRTRLMTKRIAADGSVSDAEKNKEIARRVLAASKMLEDQRERLLKSGPVGFENSRKPSNASSASMESLARGAVDMPKHVVDRSASRSLSSTSLSKLPESRWG